MKKFFKTIQDKRTSSSRTNRVPISIAPNDDDVSSTAAATRHSSNSYYNTALSKPGLSNVETATQTNLSSSTYHRKLSNSGFSNARSSCFRKFASVNDSLSVASDRGTSNTEGSDHFNHLVYDPENDSQSDDELGSSKPFSRSGHNCPKYYNRNDIMFGPRKARSANDLYWVNKSNQHFVSNYRLDRRLTESTNAMPCNLCKSTKSLASNCKSRSSLPSMPVFEEKILESGNHVELCESENDTIVRIKELHEKEIQALKQSLLHEKKEKDEAIERQKFHEAALAAVVEECYSKLQANKEKTAKVSKNCDECKKRRKKLTTTTTTTTTATATTRKEPESLKKDIETEFQHLYIYLLISLVIICSLIIFN